MGQPWATQVEICEGSAENFADLQRALEGVHTAFYLLHSINLGPHFDEIESEMARNFAKAAELAGVSQIIYLGGIANDANISKHLASRAMTGEALATTSVPVLELRAGIIIGSGSASFEMLRHLTHRLPIMTTPKWVSNRTQPIAIRDVLYYLRNAANLEKPVSRICDIGGPEVVTYAEMMQKFAGISGLRKRKIIQVPVLTPKLSSLWIGFVTPVPTSLARPLVESLISEVVVDPRKSITDLIPLPSEGLLTVSQAIQLALTRTAENSVDTRWSDAAFPTAPWQKAQSDPDWAGELTLKDHREITTDVPLAKIWEQIELVKSQANGTQLEIKKYKTVKDAAGNSQRIAVNKRIKPWWFQSEQGKVCVSVKYGSWTIELAKGKPSVEVSSGEELVNALTAIKQAVEAGELDSQIEIASNSLRSGFKR